MSELIWSEEQIQKFVTRNFPNGLKPSEVAFVSASVRNKYLTEEERLFFHLGRSEMFNRKIVHNLDEYVLKVLQLSKQLSSYTTKTGYPMPAHAAILYANIHPSDSFGAYAIFNEKIQKELVSYVRNPKHDIAVFKTMDTLIKTAYQKASGTKLFIDVDFDTQTDSPFCEFADSLNSNSVTYYAIQTRSGYHVQLLRETIKYNFHEVLQDLQEGYPSCGEIIVNKNAMVPIPGTIQGGYKVHYVF
jgi:hypothetical protein